MKYPDKFGGDKSVNCNIRKRALKDKHRKNHRKCYKKKAAKLNVDITAMETEIDEP